MEESLIKESHNHLNKIPHDTCIHMTGFFFFFFVFDFSSRKCITMEKGKASQNLEREIVDGPRHS